MFEIPGGFGYQMLSQFTHPEHPGKERDLETFPFSFRVMDV
jgi:hypothetical protein